MDPIRRTSDDELCGYVEQRGAHWYSLTVFGGVIGDHEARSDAVVHVLDAGLASLAERWVLRDRHTGVEEVVCIQEANAQSVTLARGYYSLPGVPTLTISVDQLVSGEWELSR
jgi:hypothetical protein